MEADSHEEQIESCSTSECSPLLPERRTDAACMPPSQEGTPSDHEISAKKVQHLVLDGKGSSWHRSPVFASQDKENRPEDALPVLDFDLLCATIAMQREPFSSDIRRDACDVGVQRMWEGGVLDCFEHKEIAMRTFCCPSVTYGKNLSRAGFGTCITKGGIHFLLLAIAFISYVLFLWTDGRQYLYTAISVSICVAAYSSFYRIQIRRKFNIKGNDLDGVVSAFDDSLNHFICCCCALCQEARTLEMNNVQDGNWHGRSDTVWACNYGVPSTTQIAGVLEEGVELTPPIIVTMSSEDS